MGVSLRRGWFRLLHAGNARPTNSWTWKLITSYMSHNNCFWLRRILDTKLKLTASSVNIILLLFHFSSNKFWCKKVNQRDSMMNSCLMVFLLQLIHVKKGSTLNSSSPEITKEPTHEKPAVVKKCANPGAESSCLQIMRQLWHMTAWSTMAITLVPFSCHHVLS